MDGNYILYLGRHTLETALLISAPILLACMFTGIAVSMIQTITSLKDMTMTIVPKLLAVGAMTLLFGNWMLQILMKFTLEIFTQIQSYGQ
ncbi:MAG: flagellar biosynthetic protein FliQ [Planctomycetes bacterium]|nr:flagellar biosynthetic protein FliQ [Planctomycetota bacterium]